MAGIISIPKAPETGLLIEAKVSLGKQQVVRHLQAYRNLYLDGNFVSRELVLEPGESLNLGRWTAGCIHCSAPLNLEGVTGERTLLDVTIQKFIALDAPLGDLTISAPESTGDDDSTVYPSVKVEVYYFN